jgi:hypothetical protein
MQHELELNGSFDRLIRDDGNDVKHVPQTSAATFELHQPFSPWYVITPTFSPYYVSVPTFSTFEAGFNNQFYYPKTNDKSEQN